MIYSNCLRDILNCDGSYHGYEQNIFQRLVVKLQYFTDISKIKHALKKFKYIFNNVDVTPYLYLPFTPNNYI